jgi:hypothetical protein
MTKVARQCDMQVVHVQPFIHGTVDLVAKWHMYSCTVYKYKHPCGAS